MGGFSVAKTEKIWGKSRLEAAKSGSATKLSCKWPPHGICLVYTWHTPCISCLTVNHAFWVLSISCPENPCSIDVFAIHQVLIASWKACKTKRSLKQWLYVTWTHIPWIIYHEYTWYMSCICQVCLVHSFEGKLWFLTNFSLQHYIVLNSRSGIQVGMQHRITHKYIKMEIRIHCIYVVYSRHIPPPYIYMEYTWYIPTIYLIGVHTWYIPTIYLIGVPDSESDD